jgi:hypothetical protein
MPSYPTLPRKPSWYILRCLGTCILHLDQSISVDSLRDLSLQLPYCIPSVRTTPPRPSHPRRTNTQQLGDAFQRPPASSPPCFKLAVPLHFVSFHLHSVNQAFHSISLVARHRTTRTLVSCSGGTCRLEHQQVRNRNYSLGSEILKSGSDQDSVNRVR